jgi:hypothetical protein
MAGIARSVIAQAPAVIDRDRARIDGTGGVPDWIVLALEKYSDYPRRATMPARPTRPPTFLECPIRAGSASRPTWTDIIAAILAAISVFICCFSI